MCDGGAASNSTRLLHPDVTLLAGALVYVAFITDLTGKKHTCLFSLVARSTPRRFLTVSG